MAIANLIAQAGMTAGQNIQNTVGNGLVRRENQKRYEAEQLAKEKAAQTEQVRYQNEQSRLQRTDQFDKKKHSDGQMEKALGHLAQIYQERRLHTII